jgi:hypothetical protein
MIAPNRLLCCRHSHSLRTSGILEGMPSLVLRGDPPSTYCALAFIEGQPRAGWRFLGATAVRSLFILPGLAFAGARGWGLVKGSLFASMSISTVLLLYYGYQRAKSLETGKPPPWDNGWGIESLTAQTQGAQTSTAGFRGLRGLAR